MGKYEENLALIRKVVALEPVERIPVVPCGNAYYAKTCGLPLKTYINDFDAACDVNLRGLKEMEAEASQSLIFTPLLLSAQWLCPVAVPGGTLGEDEMWQVTEKADFMKQEEYEIILEHGFGYFFEKFKKERLDDLDEKLRPFFEAKPAAAKRFYDAGIPCINSFMMITPFEYFCGGRGMENFFMDDLFDEPEMMDEVFEKTMAYTMTSYERIMQSGNVTGATVGGWRTSPQMLSPEMWERFAWPYMKAYVELCVRYNVIPLLHLDSCWDRALDRLRELPAKKCILCLDSKTDIRKAHDILGDMMCICGDVPAELLSFGTPEAVYQYVTDVIDDIGPVGYMAASGCDIPANGRRENVKAMAQAAHDYIKNHPGCLDKYF